MARENAQPAVLWIMGRSLLTIEIFALFIVPLKAGTVDGMAFF